MRRQPWAGAPSGRELLSAIVPGAALRWPRLFTRAPSGLSLLLLRCQTPAMVYYLYKSA